MNARGSRRTPPAAAILGALAAITLAGAGCGPGGATAARMEDATSTARPPVEVRAAVDRAVATTGDVITYTVTIEHDPGVEVSLPDPGSEIAGFRIVDLGREEPRTVDGRLVRVRWYELRADLVGSYILPALTVTFRPAGDDSDAAPVDEPRSVATSEIFVEVESVLPSDGTAIDIRDIKPLRPPARDVPWIRIAAAAALALLASGAAFVFWRRRRATPAAPARPAHEIAFEALDALRRTDFEDPAAVRRFHFGVSEVVRAYVEDRFGLNATDLTTEEILDRLRAGGALAALADGPRQSLEGVLECTDRVKFAGHVPSRAEIERTYEQALGFVEATRPIPPDDRESDTARAAA